jgi:hypothetical protein
MNLFSRTIVMVCIAGLSSVSLTSCKAKAVATTTVTRTVDYMKATKIIGNHYNNKSNFSTLYIRANAKYADDKQKM